MQTLQTAPLAEKLKLTSGLLTIFALLYGSLVLAGRLFGIPMLAAPIPGEGAASPISALAVILAALALRLVLKDEHTAPRIETSLYALGALSIGAFTLVMSATALQGGPGVPTFGAFLMYAPGEVPVAPSLVHGLAVVFMSLSVFLLQFPARPVRRLSEGLAFLILLFCIFVATLSLYGAGSALAGAPWLHVALADCIPFGALATAVLLARPERGIAGLLCDQRKGGTIARRSALPLLLVPIAAGFLLLAGLAAGLFQAAYGVAALVVVLSAGSLAFLWYLAGELSLESEAHSQTENALSELRRQTRMTFDTLREAFIVTDDSWTIIDWNTEASNMFGWPREEAVGMSFLDKLLSAQSREGHLETWQEFQTTGGSPVFNRQFELIMTHRDGHEFPAELSISPIRMESGDQFYTFVRNVSDRVRLARELSEARDQAVEASELKSEFLANMSHEIRTPLNAIIGMSDLLLRRPLSGELRDYANTIHDSGEALLNIVNDILDYSKIEAGKLSLETTEVDAVSLVEGAAELAAGRAREKGLSLSTFIAPDIPPVLRSDPGRVRQILLNLVTNSIKFTEAGEVVVRAVLDEMDSERAVVRFEVSDTGIGMTEDQLDRIFEPFIQADGSVTRRYGGTGLGLSICKRLVALLGGQIGAESSPGEGSRFWFTVPMERPIRRAQVTPSRLVFHDVRMLLVDGPPAASEIIRAYAASWGISCDQAESGEEALHILRREAAANSPYDLCVVDFELTFSDALGLAQSVRKYADLAHTKLILVSAFDDREIAAEALKSGYAAYLTKPVRQSRLYDCIVSILTRERLTDEAEEEGAAETQPAPQPAPPGAPSDQLILLVEDNPVNQKVALLQLNELGYGAHVASNGFEALEALARTDYALVLMDCQMPEMDGFETTRCIRKSEARTGKHIPIVAITAHAMSEDRYKCLSVGMDDYLSKPVTRKKLRDVLHRHLRQAEEVSSGTNGADSDSHNSPVTNSNAAQIDLSGLREFLDEPELNDLLRTYVQSSEACLVKMDDGVRHRDGERVKAAAHEFKGASMAVRATEVATICAAIEEAVEQETWVRTQERCAALRRAFERVKTVLSETILDDRRQSRKG